MKKTGRIMMLSLPVLLPLAGAGIAMEPVNQPPSDSGFSRSAPGATQTSITAEGTVESIDKRSDGFLIKLQDANNLGSLKEHRAPKDVKAKTDNGKNVKVPDIKQGTSVTLTFEGEKVREMQVMVR